MSANDEPFEGKPAHPGDGEDFAESLKRRREAAEGLEQDLLAEVPLLYGSPGGVDPGIALARIHREELVRRNGGGVSHPSGKRSEIALPFEGAVAALAAILCLLLLFGR